MPDLAEVRRRLDDLPFSPRTLVAVAAVVLAIAVGAAAGLASRGQHHAPPDDTLPRATPGTAPPPTGPDQATPAAADAVVDIAGAVVKPGVYKLAGDARVTDAMAAAGGATPDADLDQVNLAARVEDGQRIYVPHKGEVVPPTVSPSLPAGPIDINTATVDQLDTLPGVGPALAQAIVDYRVRHGRFRAVDDLAKVKGIGPAKLDALRNKVIVR